MAIRTTREFNNKNKARRESLREPRHDQSVFGNACGSSANRKENVLAFAGLPQIKKRTLWRLRKFRKSKRERFGVCGTPANQKRTFWRLRDSRKSKKERFGACGSSANQKKNVLALAEVPQIKKRTLWRLRDSRKSKKERFGACGSSASIPKSTLAVIALYPSHSSGIRSLILSFKLTLQRFLEREIRRRRHPFRSDRSLGGHTRLRSISEVPI